MRSVTSPCGSAATPLAAVAAALIALALVFIGVAPVPARADPALADYAGGADYLPQTPAVSGGAAGAFFNPAAWAANDRVETALWWNDGNLRREALDNWGFSLGHHLGLAVDSRVLPLPLSPGTLRRTDCQLGFAGGDRRSHFGLAYRWSTGGEGSLAHERALVTGLISRPAPWLSWGLAGTASLASGARLGVADVGVRPLAAPWLTLFADYALRDGDTLERGRWGAGVEARPVSGLHLGLKLHDTDNADRYRLSFNAGVTLGGTGFHVLPGYDRHGHRLGTTYLVRLHPPYRGLPVPAALARRGQPRWLKVDLEHKTLSHRRNRWFDDDRIAWLDLARHLDRIRDARGVAGVAVNLADLRVRPSLAWELRGKLAALRAAGKEVVVQVDELDMWSTYLASAADRVTIDPLGSVMLPGFAAYRTYLKGSLDKLGLGFQEFRYMPYKSAVEILSRTEMSPGEREQRGRLLDVAYETVRDGVCTGRRLAPARFDTLVDRQVLLGAQQAREAGLVDGIGRWNEIDDWLRQERHARATAPAGLSHPRTYHDERWGCPARIAVVYALGECAMDEGIKGRATSAELRRLVHDHDVKAVVLRADSPGGDPLPSDLVAEATAMLIAAGKPVVISQGDVAASGGYWISMNGSRILTTPLTVTGSVGVIAGWVYDEKLGEKLGLNTDGVARGAHADLFTNLAVPLTGLALPRRGLDDSELALVKKYILGMYDDFVTRVAKARHLDEARVRELAGGRVWMGGDAIDRGLCDAFGGLTDAIAEARRLAGIAPDAEVGLVEYPPRRLLALPRFGPSLPGLSSAIEWAVRRLDETAAPEPIAERSAETPDYASTVLRRMLATPARPLLLTPEEALPDAWRRP